MTNHNESDGLQQADRLTLEELSQAEFSKLHILRWVSLESVWGLLEHCKVETFSKGSTIIELGQTNQTLYLVLNGELSVHLERADADPVVRLEPGETVGEISVIDDSPATAFVRAVKTTRLLAIDERTFWRLVQASHNFATNMLLMLASRLRANNTKIIEGVNQRLQLEHEASVDALTGLRNRRWLDSNLDRLASRHNFTGGPFCVVMLDLDHFKRFNDDYGHAAGDDVLSSVASSILERLRPTDLAARYGGEEFVVMFPETAMEGALIACERLRQAVASTVVRCGGRELPPVTISLGVAQKNPDESGVKLLGRADAALYRAKENGRNRVEQ